MNTIFESDSFWKWWSTQIWLWWRQMDLTGATNVTEKITSIMRVLLTLPSCKTSTVQYCHFWRFHAIERVTVLTSRLQGRFYSELRKREIYINQPDNYFYFGGSKTGRSIDEFMLSATHYFYATKNLKVILLESYHWSFSGMGYSEQQFSLPRWWDISIRYFKIC